MFQNIRFVDLHYKGIRIQREWRHLKIAVFFILFLLGAVPALFLFVGLMGGLGIFRTEDWGLSFLFSALLPAVLAGLVVSSSSFLYLPFWDETHDLQCLCEMIYTYPLYQVQNYLEPGVSGEEKVIRKITYFPHIYYKRKKGIKLITVRLDQSEFHESGSFENLNKILEDTFCCEVIDMTKRKEYLTYHLIPDGTKNRLNISEVKPKGYQIPLMKGLSWNLSKIPHGLVVGGTGGGKSYFLNALIRGFLLMGSELYICDPKNSALADYCLVLPNVETSPEKILENVKKCVRIMENRYKTIKSGRDYLSGRDFTRYHLAPVVLILDEYTAFASALEKKQTDEFKAALNQLVLKGREAGVFVLLATQRPDAKYLDGSIRDQLGLRAVLGSMSDEGYRMTFGTVEQKLSGESGPGRGYVSVPTLKYIRRFYAPYVPDGYDFLAEAEKIYKKGRKERETCGKES